MWSEHIPLLTIRGLRKSFGTNDVLLGLDLEVRRGEVLGVVGRNGVGKTTMASIIAGQSAADGGEMMLGDGDWDPGRIMLIDPQHELDPRMTVTEAMFRQYTGERDEEDLLIRARRVLAETGIALLPADRLGDLSPTERRMAEVVRMLADPREVIVIDELSNALNALEVEDLRYALRRTSEEERGVVYITHRLDEALRLCHRVAVIRDGKVVAIFNSLTATTEQLTEAMFGQTVEVGARSSSATEDVVLDVESLRCLKEPVSFQLHAGEILGFCGSRASGVEEIRDALVGKRPCETAALRVADKPASIRAPRDLPANGIAVLASMFDPDTESYSARNMTMLDGDTDVDEATIEDTTKILLALRESEMQMSRLLNRPMQSTGQRRWQQMQELAGEHAQVLILIEPLDGLDASARQRFAKLMADVTGRGAGVLLFSSDEADLHRFSDRIMVLADGRVQGEWDPEEVTSADLERVTRGEWSFEPRAVV